jgi:hypothetical protein
MSSSVFYYSKTCLNRAPNKNGRTLNKVPMHEIFVNIQCLFFSSHLQCLMISNKKEMINFKISNEFKKNILFITEFIFFIQFFQKNKKKH